METCATGGGAGDLTRRIEGLTFRMGQTHAKKYYNKLLDMIMAGEIDPSFVITHHMNLDDAPKGYKMFRDKQDGCIKVVLHP